MRTKQHGSSFVAPKMPLTSLARKGSTAVGTVMLASAIFVPALSSPAFATPTCPAGSSSIGAGICEVVFTADGTWTPPSGVTKLEALLVGAGGASNNGYGGGGGDVRIVTLANSGTATVVVGAGRLDDDGEPSTITQGALLESAEGGQDGNIDTFAGASGSGQEGSDALYGGGGGAAAPGIGASGGAGIIVSSLTSTLFTSITDCYGGGGGGIDETATTPNATCGGGYSINIVQDSGVYSAEKSLPVPNSGGGAGAYVVASDPSYYSEAYAGADGKVVLRFLIEDQLAKTGNSSSAILGSSLLAAAAGATLLAFARRRGA